MSKPDPPTHVFDWDGITDPTALKPEQWCNCMRKKTHPIHDVKPQTPEQDAADAARLGESEEA